MSRTDPLEKDWKIFRELREVALERLCERALRKARAVVEDPSKPALARFRDLAALVDERQDWIARGFDDAKRSAMLFQLAFLHAIDLVEGEELARFSAATRERVVSLASVISGAAEQRR